jgi:putative Holliday junction resolvase
MAASADAPAGARPRVALALDFGLRWIGAATGQTVTATASARGALRARDGVPDWDALGRLVAEWGPDVIVVGLPLNMDGTESEMSRRARRFGNRVNARTGVPVEFQDERLTSREAAARAAPGTDRNALHGEAARVILEDWLAGAGG